MNRPVSTTDPLGNTSSLTYDAAGNVSSVTDPLGRTSQRTYNELGYQTTRRTPLGFVTSFGRDAEGQLTSSPIP